MQRLPGVEALLRVPRAPLVVGPVVGTFGQPVDYTPAGGSTVRITAVFTEAYVSIDPMGPPGVSSVGPRLGVQVSQLAAGWDPINAQGDTFTVVLTGKTYVVRQGMPDGKGRANLDANLAP